MNVYVPILIVILFFDGCENTKKTEIIDSSYTNVGRPCEEVDDYSKFGPEIIGSHKLSLSCDGEYLPVRKRILDKPEIALSNSGTEQDKLLNDSNILAYIYNDQPLDIVDTTQEFYKIRFYFKNEIIEGYILKNFCGKSTIKPITDILHQHRNSNFILNPELLPYCRVFVSEKLHNLLIGTRKSKSALEHFRTALSQVSAEIVIYSLFVGQSERVLYKIKYPETSTPSPVFFCVKNTYFTYEFGIFFNMFFCMKPQVPFQIDSYLINNDTLKLTIDDYYNNPSKLKLFPIDSKRAFTSRKGAVWILNDEIRLKDISYIADRLSVPETQIEHTYFYDILELYIQDILPKRPDTYLKYYFKE